MTDSAETTQAEGAAPAAELSVPKYRLDEVTAQLRRKEEEIAMKDRLYLEDRQRAMAQSQNMNREAELTPEETGLDPQTHKAVLLAASKIAERTVAREKAIWGQQIGLVAERAEKAELLAAKGSDKAKYIPEIKRMQQEQWNQTGSYMSAEIALDLLLSKEKDERIRQLEAKIAGTAPASGTAQNPPPVASATPNPGGVPSPQGTRTIPQGGAAGGISGGAKKSFSELSVEEMEARLQEQFTGGAIL